ncbi:alanyl-tRNA editing protein AlaXM [Haladaptatus pallidirubidus]|uniref:Alanyl-tRNA editing protein n=1 Tax=Haladaptatus pallidirubidus TaxID=1008152 RepID=A0AAV3UCA1_9EURY|nr:alanyl-tRNA editing protein AlaXM [Haladaptatus pallidirubidus]
MTEALYLDETGDAKFEATVERVAGDRVVLDRTLFYPEGGGQPSDTGVLEADGETWNVTAVRKKDTVYHTVDRTPPEKGTTVTGRIDWERRYAHMRYHTAQHLLSAVLLDEYDAQTTGNQLYADRARIDCAYERFSDEEFAHIESVMNDRIGEGLEVRWYEMERDEAESALDPERTRIHLLPDSIREVRIVEIEECDRTACAGTHVENTDEIGEFRITGRETKGSDEERLKFVLE